MLVYAYLKPVDDARVTKDMAARKLDRLLQLISADGTLPAAIAAAILRNECAVWQSVVRESNQRYKRQPGRPEPGLDLDEDVCAREEQRQGIPRA